MRAENIKREVARLKAKFQASDPYSICRALGIRVSQAPMGVRQDSCKGFFIVNARCKLIMLNSDLEEEVRRIILAHELGHAILHCSPSIRAFHDFQVLDDIPVEQHDVKMDTVIGESFTV